MNEEEILYRFRNRVDDCREQFVLYDIYVDLRNTLELIENLKKRNKELEEKNKKVIDYINDNGLEYNCNFMDNGVGNLFQEIKNILEDNNV